MSSLLPDLPLLAPRVSLRALVSSDRDALFAMLSDPEVMRYWSSVPFTSVEQADELVASALTDPSASIRLGVVEGTALVGFVSLHAVSWPNRRAELGYMIGRASWGRGLAREAVRLIVQHAFRTVGLHRLEADTDPRNARSMALLERLGFRQEGLLRERWWVGGEPADTAFFGLLAHEWSP
jgi:RimJ/RimL family protein N-acetyltransferase